MGVNKAGGVGRQEDHKEEGGGRQDQGQVRDYTNSEGKGAGRQGDNEAQGTGPQGDHEDEGAGHQGGHKVEGGRKRVASAEERKTQAAPIFP